MAAFLIENKYRSVQFIQIKLTVSRLDIGHHLPYGTKANGVAYGHRTSSPIRCPGHQALAKFSFSAPWIPAGACPRPGVGDGREQISFRHEGKKQDGK
jgi:hypothetical protein